MPGLPDAERGMRTITIAREFEPSSDSPIMTAPIRDHLTASASHPAGPYGGGTLHPRRLFC